MFIKTNIRRAKEKLKASKAAKNGDTDTKDKTESSDDDRQSSQPPPALRTTPPAIDLPQSQPPSTSTEQTSTSNVSSPLQIATEPKRSTWEDPRVDPQFLYPGHHIHAYRRGSLPANAFPTADFPLDGPSLDEFDPLARRRSVDASLQRLANNPYAPLARAKNGAIYGPRAVAPIRRSLCRTPFNPTPRIAASAPYRLDIRRASMGNFRISPRGTAPPSPSSSSPYNMRASLPEHNLFAVSSRTISPPLPGPLPSPSFSFGAASTPSMLSTSSADSERYSPDPQQYTYRENEQDEDEGTPMSYCSSRFGSITSIATSDSSLNSAYFPDQVSCFDEQELGSRRGSW